MTDLKLLQKLCDKYGLELVSSWNRYWIQPECDYQSSMSFTSFTPGLVFIPEELSNYSLEQLETLLLEFVIDNTFER